MTLEVAGYYDQELNVGAAANAALQYVDKLVDAAITEGNDTRIAAFVRDQKATMHISGLSLAKLLYRWREARAMFGISNDDFEDKVYAETGISAQTTRKYIGVWESVFVRAGLASDILNSLLGKPMQGLLLLPAAVQEGQLDEEDWAEIAEAPDPAAIKEVVRRKRGQVTNSHTAITIRQERDGTLTAYRGDEQEAIGYLSVDNESELAQSAIARIVREARVLCQ